MGSEQKNKRAWPPVASGPTKRAVQHSAMHTQQGAFLMRTTCSAFDDMQAHFRRKNQAVNSLRVSVQVCYALWSGPPRRRKPPQTTAAASSTPIRSALHATATKKQTVLERS